MKTHTNSFKQNIAKLGKRLDSKIIYEQNGVTIELGKTQLNSITPHYEGAILKSVMKQLDIDSNVEIPVGTILTYELGVKVGNSYEYLNFGDYVVYKVEKQEDTRSWLITCYDKMLYSMVDYEALNITYPITIRNYINAICSKLGLTFKNAGSTFANYNKEIPNELYLDENGKSLGYTFRDVLDELAEVTASTICINENDSQLEIRYITNTNDTIDEEFLKDVNVNFGEKFGAVNTIVLSRSAGADNIYYPSTLPANPVEIKISDNQIMNGNDRDTYLPDIYNKLNGLEYYINDFSSTGICYYDLCDRYNVQIGDKTYSCVMFNDEVNVTQGLQENVYTDMPEEAVTDYTKADKTDRKINQTTLIVDKQQGEITALVDTTQEIQKEINPTDTASGSSISLDDSAEADLIDFELEGKTTQETRSGKNLFNINTATPHRTDGRESVVIENGVLTITALTTSGAQYAIVNIENLNSTKNYTLSFKAKKIVAGTDGNPRIYFRTYGSNDGSAWTSLSSLGADTPTQGQEYSYDVTVTGYTYYRFYIYNNSGNPVTVGEQTQYYDIQFEEGNTATEYEPYGIMPSPEFPSELVSVGYQNIFTGLIKGIGLNSTTGAETVNENAGTSDFIKVDFNTNQNYYLSGLTNTIHSYVAGYNSNKQFLGRTGSTRTTQWGLTSTSFTSGTPQGSGDIAYLRVTQYAVSADTGTIDDIDNLTIQLETGNTPHSYIPYGKFGIEVKISDSNNTTKTYLYTLDQPLRSIEDTKDLLYIKNGTLYVERYIGSVVLDGSETWTLSQTNNVFYMAFSETNFLISDNKPMSDYFIGTQNVGSASGMGAKDMNTIALSSSSVSNIRIYIKTNVVTTKNELTQWLSTHNTEVQYILAEPYTEEIGQVDIPSTYKGITHINTTDELEPNMNITYVRDTQISNYVEQHISEIKINEQGITERVESIENNGLEDRVQSVETRQTATERTIEIKTQNIDAEGNITEVRTSRGFTFDDNGLDINTGENSFHTTIDEDSTDYKDGNTIVSTTSKDGSALRMLRMLEQNYYSYNDSNPNNILDTSNYDFIDERIEVDGEYAYATFYNGED